MGSQITRRLADVDSLRLPLIFRQVVHAQFLLRFVQAPLPLTHHQFLALDQLYNGIFVLHFTNILPNQINDFSPYIKLS